MSSSVRISRAQTYRKNKEHIDMSGETGERVSGWTVDTLKVLMDERSASQHELSIERDRRYLEVNIEKEKALKIKETADLAALSLAREIQDYKDEKANNLRDQIGSERGTYATKEDVKNISEKFEAQIQPVASWVQSQQGVYTQQRQQQARSEWSIGIVMAVIFGVTGTLGTVLGVVYLIVSKASGH
jgi:hypothetical protein